MLLSASRIHDGNCWLPEGSVIAVDDTGTITAIHSLYKGDEAVVHYEGVLAPGFVNVHCHLELSHMKGLAPEHTGLMPFLQQVIFHRNDFTEEEKKVARYKAYRELIDNGVVATGDISNGNDTLDIRALDEMHIHTFVESLGFTETRAAQSFAYAAAVYDAFAAQNAVAHKKILAQSIVPHAPYSVSEALFRLIDAHQPEMVIAMHNQETEAEDNYYIDKTGGVNDLHKILSIDADFFQASGKSSLQTYLNWITPGHPFIFVHNTCTTAADVLFAQSKQTVAYWCLCPNANLYIENLLPDVPMLQEHNAHICIGTDSLTSNHELSILSELCTLKTHFPALEWETLLKWGTSNGAAALQMQERIGTLTIGKQPGIIHITGLENVGKRPVVVRVL